MNPTNSKIVKRDMADHFGIFASNKKEFISSDDF